MNYTHRREKKVAMIDKEVLEFLKELKEHNDRDWFHEHKGRYTSARKKVEEFLNRLIPLLKKFDPTLDMITAKDCLFRIYRDVRFSADKSPYKTNIGAYLARGGRKSPYAGYYVHIEPGSSFLAGGMYMPEAGLLRKIREEIYYNVDEYLEILEDETFRKYFGHIDDPGKLKSAPKGFDKDWPHIDLLRFKSYAVAHHVTDEQVKSADFLQYSEGVFRVLHKLNSFFNKTLDI